MSGQQTPFSTTVLNDTDNPDPRCPVMLLLDTSFSMDGEPINELNAGLHALVQDLLADSKAKQRVELGVTTFGPIHVHDFLPTDHFHPPQLKAAGDTPMGSAIMTGLDALEARKALYRSRGLLHYRPWVFLITDGGPTEDPAIVQAAISRVHAGISGKKFLFFAVGVQNADMQTLTHIAGPGGKVAKLDGFNFREMFAWLSASLSKVAESNPGEMLALPNPKWAVQV